MRVGLATLVVALCGCYGQNPEYSGPQGDDLVGSLNDVDASEDSEDEANSDPHEDDKTDDGGDGDADDGDTTDTTGDTSDPPGTGDDEDCVPTLCVDANGGASTSSEWTSHDVWYATTFVLAGDSRLRAVELFTGNAVGAGWVGVGTTTSNAAQPPENLIYANLNVTPVPSWHSGQFETEMHAGAGQRVWLVASLPAGAQMPTAQSGLELPLHTSQSHGQAWVRSRDAPWILRVHCCVEQ